MLMFVYMMHALRVAIGINIFMINTWSTSHDIYQKKQNSNATRNKVIVECTDVISLICDRTEMMGVDDAETVQLFIHIRVVC